MRQGRTLTKHLSLETRQYDLLIWDVSEGAPRRMIALIGVTVVLWILLLAPFLGFPRNGWGLAVYLMPPAVFAWFAWQKSPTHDNRRRRLTDWVVAARYARSGHRPIISLGARHATAAELIPLRERLPLEGLVHFFDIRQGPRSDWHKTKRHPRRERLPAGAAIDMQQSVRLLDADQITAARDRSVRRISKQRRSTTQGA